MKGISQEAHMLNSFFGLCGTPHYVVLVLKTILTCNERTNLLGLPLVVGQHLNREETCTHEQ